MDKMFKNSCHPKSRCLIFFLTKLKVQYHHNQERNKSKTFKMEEKYFVLFEGSDTSSKNLLFELLKANRKIVKLCQLTCKFL